MDSATWSIIASIGSGIAIIASLKTDIRWIKRWMREHDERDAKSFEAVWSAMGRRKYDRHISAVQPPQVQK